MKKIYIALTGIFVLSAFGCNKDYLDVTPQDKIDAAAFFNNETDLNVYTNAFYDMLPTNSATIYTVYKLCPTIFCGSNPASTAHTSRDIA